MIWSNVWLMNNLYLKPTLGAELSVPSSSIYLSCVSVLSWPGLISLGLGLPFLYPQPPTSKASMTPPFMSLTCFWAEISWKCWKVSKSKASKLQRSLWQNYGMFWTTHLVKIFDIKFNKHLKESFKQEKSTKIKL